MKPSMFRTIAKRVIAGVLALALLWTGVLFTQTGVSLNPSAQRNDAARFAAMRLLQSDEYASSSAFGRVTMLMKNYLTLVKDFDDYELGASIAISRGNYADAAACTEQAISLYKGEREGLDRLYLRQGYLCILMEQYEQAEEWLTRGSEGSLRNEALPVRAQVRFELGNSSGAVEDADACVSASLEPELVLPSLVYIYEGAGEYARLADVYTRMLNNEQLRRTEYLLNRASCYANLDEKENAEADCMAYIASGGEEVTEAWSLIGLLRMRSAQYAEAAEAFGNAVNSASSPSDDLLYYAVLCAGKAGDTDRQCLYGDMAHARSASVPDTSRIVHLEQGSRSGLLLMTARAHMEREEYLEAAGLFAVYTSENPTGEPVRFQRGTCLLAAGMPQQAAEEIKAAIAAGEDELQCRYTLGLCLLQTGSLSEAAEQFDWVLDNGGDPELQEQALLMKQYIEKGNVG